MAGVKSLFDNGKGIYGIEAASRSYFNKPAVSLSRQESAMVAACLPNPKRYTVKPLGGYVANRRFWVLAQMNSLEGDPDIQKIIQDKTPKKAK